MIVMKNFAEAHPGRTARTLSGGQPGWTTEYFGPPPVRPSGVPDGDGDRAPLPQAFLVEQSADSEVRPHFHLADQFQVVVSGGGTMGKHPIRAVSVHYASRSTSYGPIRAGCDGLSYFTRRRAGESGAWYMPESRLHLDRDSRRRQITRAAPPLLSSDGLGAGVTRVIDPQPDGVACSFLAVGRGGSAALPDDGAGGGRFHIVLDGTLLVGSRVLDRLSVVFVSREERGEAFSAGDGGCQLLSLQFPQVPAATA